MKLRRIVAWCSVAALLGTGAANLWAQPPQPPRAASGRIERDKLRAEIIELRTEVEMLRFDYEFARNALLEEVKFGKQLRMASGMLQFGVALQTAVDEADEEPSGVAARQKAEEQRKQKAEEAKAAEQEEKEYAATEAAFITEQKKELARRFALLAAKQLDLEDAERDYRELAR